MTGIKSLRKKAFKQALLVSLVFVILYMGIVFWNVDKGMEGLLYGVVVFAGGLSILYGRLVSYYERQFLSSIEYEIIEWKKSLGIIALIISVMFFVLVVVSPFVQSASAFQLPGLLLPMMLISLDVNCCRSRVILSQEYVVLATEILLKSEIKGITVEGSNVTYHVTFELKDGRSYTFMLYKEHISKIQDSGIVRMS